MLAMILSPQNFKIILFVPAVQVNQCLIMLSQEVGLHCISFSTTGCRTI